MSSRRLPGFLNRPTLIPAVLIAGVAGTLLLLVFQITLRPWGKTDTGIDTHLNYVAVADDYSRSEISTVGFAAHSPSGWVLANIPDEQAEDAGLQYYVASGCASCHGLLGEGNVIGPDLVESSPSEIRRESRGGPGGMPSYDNPGLLDEQLALISDYLISQREAAEALIAAARLSEPVPIPMATPWPSPTPFPTATPVPSPTPTNAVATPPTAGGASARTSILKVVPPLTSHLRWTAPMSHTSSLLALSE